MATILSLCYGYIFFFFFNDTATTEIYTLSLHDALPISGGRPYNPVSAATCASSAGEGAGGPSRTLPPTAMPGVERPRSASSASRRAPLSTQPAWTWDGNPALASSTLRRSAAAEPPPMPTPRMTRSSLAVHDEQRLADRGPRLDGGVRVRRAVQRKALADHRAQPAGDRLGQAGPRERPRLLQRHRPRPARHSRRSRPCW